MQTRIDENSQVDFNQSAGTKRLWILTWAVCWDHPRLKTGIVIKSENSEKYLWTAANYELRHTVLFVLVRYHYWACFHKRYREQWRNAMININQYKLKKKQNITIIPLKRQKSVTPTSSCLNLQLKYIVFWSISTIRFWNGVCACLKLS